MTQSTRREVSTIGGSARNYFETAAIKAYLNVREHWAFYLSLLTQGERRGFTPKLISALEAFLRETNEEHERCEVDEILAARASALPWRSGVAVVEATRRQEPRGSALLGLEAGLTFESLNMAYRKASLTHHPDAGGTHDNMVAVNAAQSFAHELLCLKKTGASTGNGGVRERLQTCEEARTRYTAELFRAHVEMFDVEAAFGLLSKVFPSYGQGGGKPSVVAMSPNSDGDTTDVWRLQRAIEAAEGLPSLPTYGETV